LLFVTHFIHNETSVRGVYCCLLAVGLLGIFHTYFFIILSHLFCWVDYPSVFYFFFFFIIFNESDYDIDAPTTSTPRGRSTYKLSHITQKYRKESEQLPSFKNWLGPVKDITKANCYYCKQKIVSEITTIKKHAAFAAHLKNAKSITGKPLTNFFKKVDENEVKKFDRVKRAEILICNFLSEHNISFNTADHLTQILKKALPDSDIVKKIVLGWQKN
jgi:hypothetical protein